MFVDFVGGLGILILEYLAMTLEHSDPDVLVGLTCLLMLLGV